MFRKLFRSGGQPPPRPDISRPPWKPFTQIEVKVAEGETDLYVVGESHYQGQLRQLVGGVSNERVRKETYAVLVPETDNQYDPNAISVWISGLHVGYLSREDAQRYRPGLLALGAKYGLPIALRGVIAGGGMREDGLGRLGVFLRHDPTDFGLPAPSTPAQERLRKALSEVSPTHVADESGEMGWRSQIPHDDVKAITMLRRLLKEARNPIDRHFMFCDLERALYRSREAFTSALDEFDEVCRQHDAEMETVREASIAKWGKAPFGDTYKQMCVRQQKAKNFEQALWWAERGIAVLGGEAYQVEDLKKRAETYRAKLGP